MRELKERKKCLSVDERVTLALENKEVKGYNCAQAVVCAFKDKYDLPESVLFRVSEGFGLGMGAESVCGAVTAMSILTGLENSDSKLSESETKKKSREFSAACFADFKKKNSSVECFELRGEDDGVVLRSCLGCIEEAVRIFDKKTNKKFKN